MSILTMTTKPCKAAVLKPKEGTVLIIKVNQTTVYKVIFSRYYVRVPKIFLGIPIIRKFISRVTSGRTQLYQKHLRDG
ncbi:unnamed protein product [Trifolium pratense]|uniref:Uncharacterized protein n=1 Tax=Trifolium pratense TaxID=57577 RepID=A0ACB0MF73_TRIPR|nr:unnamed protein product [Trifolium pratense]